MTAHRPWSRQSATAAGLNAETAPGLASFWADPPDERAPVRRFPVIARVLLPLLLLVAACGSDDGGGESASAEDESTTTTTAAIEPAQDDPSLDAITVEGAFGEPPTVDFEPPFETETTVRRILEEGDGDPVESGMTVSFENVGIDGRDGTEFDNSFETQPVSIVMDETQIIPGLIKGLLGVPVHSRVLMALAPADAFEAQGGIAEAGIEATDTIIFVVDVLEASIPLDRATGTEVEPEDGLPTVELDDTGKPAITLPEGDPPTELVTQVLIEGDGPEVEEGQTITAHYTGVIWPGGEQFDSSWDRGEPASFPIGVGGVIPGWDEGLVGQTVGSQILLVIPPDQGYGPDGNPDAGIEGTDTLVFVVDILAAG